MPNIGDLVDVEYLDCEQGGVGRVSGNLGAYVDAQDRVKGIVVETDGGATFILADAIISIRPSI